MRFSVLSAVMLGAVMPMASAFAPAAGLKLTKMASPAVTHFRASVVSDRRPARLADLKATAALSVTDTITGGPRSEADYTVPEWRKKVDLKTWAEEVRAVEKKYRNAQSVEEDVVHMKKMLSWTYVLYAIGLATAGIGMFGAFNPIAALCLSTAICMRWTMIGHHVCHGGYNAQVGIENRFHRATFARGPVRRFMDWCDWMLPEVFQSLHSSPQSLHSLYSLHSASTPITN